MARRLAALLVVVALGIVGTAGQALAQDPTSTTTTTEVPAPPPPAPVPPPPPPPAVTFTPEQFMNLMVLLFGPPPPAGSGSGRRIVYAVRAQRVWLIDEAEKVVRTYRVSGRAGTPRPGNYRVDSKSAMSSSGSVRMRHMVRFARGRSLAIGFHSIPFNRRGRPIQSEAQLGTYRSHGCVRQANGDAKALYDWAPVDTPVVVVG
ncbi:MAG TPA: L,D-transpeptidase [Microthrixaceae bacterium]|nr:L,D-transpeptidase [Microthrixaceae bacterium]